MMSSFVEKYFGHELAKRYGESNARTNDMKPVKLDHHKKVFDRYRDELSTMLNDPKAPVRTIRRATARSYSIDDLLSERTPQRTDPAIYGLPQSAQASSVYGFGDAKKGGYFDDLKSFTYRSGAPY